MCKIENLSNLGSSDSSGQGYVQWVRPGRAASSLRYLSTGWASSDGCSGRVGGLSEAPFPCSAERQEILPSGLEPLFCDSRLGRVLTCCVLQQDLSPLWALDSSIGKMRGLHWVLSKLCCNLCGFCLLLL